MKKTVVKKSKPKENRYRTTTNKFIEMRCKLCDEVEMRFDAYYLIYKLSGTFTPLRADLCSKCWAELGFPKFIAKMEKALRESRNDR